MLSYITQCELLLLPLTMELSREILLKPAQFRAELRRQETVTGNPLSIDVIYMQRFELLDGSNDEDFEGKVETYARDLLNDTAIGIVFFKVQVFSNKGVTKEESIEAEDYDLKKELILHFHAFSVEYLTKEKVDKIGKKRRESLLDSEGKELAKLKETQLMVHNNTFPRRPEYE